MFVIKRVRKDPPAKCVRDDRGRFSSSFWSMLTHFACRSFRGGHYCILLYIIYHFVLVDGIENVTNKKEKPKKTNPTNKQTLATPTRRLTIRWQNEKVLRFRDLLDDVIEVCRRCNGHLPWKVETYDTNWLKLKICPGGRFIPFSMNSSYLCIFYMQSTVHLDILICNSLSSIQMYAILNVNMLALISYTLIPRIT